MLYELPSQTEILNPEWNGGEGSIPAKSNNGTAIDLPVFKGLNVLTLGITGTGKTDSFTLPAARILLNANPTMKGVFFETKTDFIDAFMEGNDKVVAYDTSVVPSGNLFKWCMIKEIRQARDKEAEMRQIAEVLFNDLISSINAREHVVVCCRIPA